MLSRFPAGAASTLGVVVLASLFGFSVATPLGGCIQQPGSGDAGSGAGGDGGSSGLVDGGAAGPTAQGADCIVEPTTGLHICTAISICPKVVIDHEIFPNCGFRIHGQALDMECACSGMICPLGAPTTCDQAVTLLRNQTELQVCQQVNEGRCTPGASAGGSSSSGAAPNGCDKTCASECAGDPNCVRLCGC
jgi:hypothetical protein